MVPILRTVVGLLLITVGVIGLVLPIIPGIPLLLAGVAAMGRDHPWLHPIRGRLDRWRRRKPSSETPLE